MIVSPFPLLRQFSDQLTVALFTKSDDVGNDNEAANAIGASSAVGLWQMHGKKTVIVRAPSARSEQADGMLTDVSDLALCLRWADCQNFVVYAPDHHVTGMLHAGWRGLIAGAIPEFFASLKREWGIDASATFVGAGPSLCQRCAEFSDPHRELPSLDKKFIDGKQVNLQAAATAQMLECGVHPDRIERHSDCTRCEPGKYWTYRGGDREAVIAGHTNMLVCCMK